MTNPTFLQILLLLNVFIMGIVVAVAVRHGHAHFWPTHQESDKHAPRPPVVQLPPQLRQRLLQASQNNFQKVLEQSADELQRDLRVTALHLNGQLEKLGTKIVSDETDRYHTGLDQLRQQAEITINGAQTEIDKHQAELKAKLAEHQAQLEAQLTEKVAAEQQLLIRQMDTKLADAVASFLTETLQHNVDLGAQTSYLTALLEEHKDELTRSLGDEA
ncbi:MAG: periplasmic heavy metal sensor [Candidatus Saccharibacteria bacterium]